jgi:hypothetical protein
MLTGKYARLHEGTWGVEVDGPVEIGQRVSIPRPDGSVHVHTIAEVHGKGGRFRICAVVPVTSDRIKEVFHAN